MIFARYKGTERAGFTRGRTYLAKPEMEDKGLVGFGFLEVTDDGGIPARFDPEKEMFEFVEEVYAVVLSPMEGLERGEVVLCDDASDDRTQLSVKGSGFWKADRLEVLDGTNVFPGLVVCHGATGRWVRVSRVDEALWVSPEGWAEMRSPEEFRFAVSEGDEPELMLGPFVRCVRAEGCADLTLGNRYCLVESGKDGGVVVRDDQGVVGEYSADRFRMG